MSNIKGLELKGGKIVIESKEKELRTRKNYSLPKSTIDDVITLSKKLDCSESEAVVEAIKVVMQLLEDDTEKAETEEVAVTKEKKKRGRPSNADKSRNNTNAE